MRFIKITAIAALALAGVVSAGCDMEPRDTDRDVNPAVPNDMNNPNQGTNDLGNPNPGGAQ